MINIFDKSESIGYDYVLSFLFSSVVNRKSS